MTLAASSKRFSSIRSAIPCSRRLRRWAGVRRQSSNALAAAAMALSAWAVVAWATRPMISDGLEGLTELNVSVVTMLTPSMTSG